MTEGTNGIFISKHTSDALALIEFMMQRGFVATANWGNGEGVHKNRGIFEVTTDGLRNAVVMIRDFPDEVPRGSIPYKIVEILAEYGSNGNGNGNGWMNSDRIMCNERLKGVEHVNPDNMARVLKKMSDAGYLERRKNGKGFEYRVPKSTLRLMTIDNEALNCTLAEKLAMQSI